MRSQTERDQQTVTIARAVLVVVLVFSVGLGFTWLYAWLTGEVISGHGIELAIFVVAVVTSAEYLAKQRP